MNLLYRTLGFVIRVLDVVPRKKASFPPRRVYFLRTHAIGDVLLSTAAVRAVKLAWPQTHVTMLVGRKSRPALEGNPYIDVLESFPEEWWFGKKFGKILKMTWHLRRKPKDALVILHASPLIHLWGFMIGAPIRVGFDKGGSGFALTHRVVRKEEDHDRYLGDVNLDLAKALGISADDPGLDFFPHEEELRAARRFLSEHRENLDASALAPPSGEVPVGAPNRLFTIGIAPGGGRNAFERISVKQWPAGHYADLMIELSKERHVEFFLLGDENDVQADEIAQMTSGHVQLTNLKGKTTFRELAALIYHLDILITNDSSPLHLAVALKKPVVALFGPTANWALFPPGPDRMALQSPAECSPCYTFGRFPGCPKPACTAMAELSVSTVLTAVESLLGSMLEEKPDCTRC